MTVFPKMPVMWIGMQSRAHVRVPAKHLSELIVRVVVLIVLLWRFLIIELFVMRFYFAGSLEL